jgi:uncharacterized membrane protein
MKAFSLTIGTVLCALSFLPVAHMQDTGTGTTQPHEEFSTATVTAITSESQTNDVGVQDIVQHVQMEMKSGPETGKDFLLDNGIVNQSDEMRLKVGETVVIDKTFKSDGSVLYLIKEKYRLSSLLWLTLLFVGITVIFGKWTGLTSIVGLVASITILMLFVIPRIVAGDDPMITCVIGASIIACTSLYLAHGFNKRTSVALLSTIVTLCISVVVALLYVHVAKLFGMGSEESFYLQSGLLQNIDLRGLLLGGMIIGCLGVLDDVTTAQCAAIDEISKANPKLTQQNCAVQDFLWGVSILLR